MVLLYPILIVSLRFEKFASHFRDLLVGKTNEEFDSDRKARELRKKLSIHDPMEL